MKASKNKFCLYNADAVINAAFAHPYLTALAVCLLLNPLHYGSIQNISDYSSQIVFWVIIFAVAILFCFLYKKCSSLKTKCLAVVGFAVATIIIIFLFKIYSVSENKAVFIFYAVCFSAFLLYFLAEINSDDIKRRFDVFLIMSISFAQKLHYILITSVYTRQNDVHHFGGEKGHAGYIEYLLYNHSIANFDVRERWQFYHPPLHHSISAAWIWINENIFMVGANAARESLQTLSLFYTLCIIITAYKILRHFKLSGIALYVPLIIIAFHPCFTIYSSAINNDPLALLFTLLAVLYTLKWYRNRSFKVLMKISVFMGLAMMTKLTSAVAAPAIAIVLLAVLIQEFKENSGKSAIKYIKQYVCFLLVCAPMGLWYQGRNFIKFGVPITYVQGLSTGETQYLKGQNFLDRITDFSSYQFDSVFEQWAQKQEDGSIIGYNEFNPLVALLKNSIFGESINEHSFSDETILCLCNVFFWLAAVIAVLFFVNMAVSLFLKHKNVKAMDKAFLATFYFLLMLSFYIMSAAAPFTCSMNFRYITPTVIITSLFAGLSLDKLKDSSISKTGIMIINTTAITVSIAFAWMSIVIYLGLNA